MKLFKVASLLLLCCLFTSFTTHKFYVSTTNLEYVPEEKSVQIITKIFIDDVENAIKERYGVETSLDTKKETKADREFLKKYILQKLQVKVNGKEEDMSYLGVEYDIDIVKAYIEINGVRNLKSLEIENTVLMDMFEEQQNIIHIKTPKMRRSIILEKENPKGLLNFE
jgi:hypothetical protein